MTYTHEWRIHKRVHLACGMSEINDVSIPTMCSEIVSPWRYYIRTLLYSAYLTENIYSIIDPAQRWKTLSNFFTCQLFGTHEREAFSGSLEVHMQPLQKIMSHSKSPR